MTLYQKEARKKNTRENHPLQLTPRDQEILLLLYHNRCMKTEQVAECVFKYKNGKENTHFLRIAQRRLKQLYDNQFVERFYYLKEAGRSGYYYVLDEQGAQVIAEHLQKPLHTLKWRRDVKRQSVAYLDHSAQINDVYIGFRNHAKKHNHEMDAYKAENHLRHPFTYGKEQHIFNPDAYLRYFTENEGMHCFIELDKGTDNMKGIVDKIKRYRLFYASGEYRALYETFPYVCFVVPDAKRKETLRRLIDAEDRSDIQWLFKTKAEVVDNPLCQWMNRHGESVHLIEP